MLINISMKLIPSSPGHIKSALIAIKEENWQMHWEAIPTYWYLTLGLTQILLISNVWYRSLSNWYVHLNVWWLPQINISVHLCANNVGVYYTPIHLIHSADGFNHDWSVGFVADCSHQSPEAVVFISLSGNMNGYIRISRALNIDYHHTMP